MTPEAILALLEESAFLLAEPAEAPGEAAEGWCAEVAITSPLSGRVRLAMATGPAEATGAELMGLSPGADTPPELGRQTVAELANVLAGRLGAERVGEGCDVVVGLPELRQLNHSAWAELAGDRDCYCFDCMGDPLLVCVSWD